MRIEPTIRIGDWESLRQDASLIRHEVFVGEQQVPLALEIDDMDPQCLHAVAYDAAGTPIATGRLLPDGHIGRMAVRQSDRGCGVGGLVLQTLMQAARQRGHRQVRLNAQLHASAFYGRYGFAVDGDEFMEANIAHIHMRATLD